MSKPAMRVAVTGAAGKIGYALLFRIASGEMPAKINPSFCVMKFPTKKRKRRSKAS